MNETIPIHGLRHCFKRPTAAYIYHDMPFKRISSPLNELFNSKQGDIRKTKNARSRPFSCVLEGDLK